jgi:succinate dehydrogenase / fumarate reductase flavoprotein subunit
MTTAENNEAAAPAHIETDVLVIGAGGAGMYAALEAAVPARWCSGGPQPDRARRRHGHGANDGRRGAGRADAGSLGISSVRHARGRTRTLRDERLAALLCEDGPRRLREMDGWKVGWAREDGHIKQAQAPGHDRPRCAYVDFLSTGPAVSRTLRSQLNAANGVRRIGELVIVDIAVRDGEACGATALHLPTGQRRHARLPRPW